MMKKFCNFKLFLTFILLSQILTTKSFSQTAANTSSASDKKVTSQESNQTSATTSNAIAPEDTTNKETLISPSSVQTTKSKEVLTDKKGDVKDSVIVNENNSSAISDILLNKNPKSLMFDDEQLDNINRAADSFTNNQAFVPTESASSEVVDEKALEEARLKAEEQQAQSEKSYLYLSSVMYFSPTNWVVWIGDQKISNKTNDRNKELSIEKISSNKSVKILWKLGISKWKIITGKRNDSDLPKTNDLNQIEVRFELKPNQTFILTENKVVEGKALTSSRSEPTTNANNTSPTNTQNPTN